MTDKISHQGLSSRVKHNHKITCSASDMTVFRFLLFCTADRILMVQSHLVSSLEYDVHSLNCCFHVNRRYSGNRYKLFNVELFEESGIDEATRSPTDKI